MFYKITAVQTYPLLPLFSIYNLLQGRNIILFYSPLLWALWKSPDHPHFKNRPETSPSNSVYAAPGYFASSVDHSQTVYLPSHKRIMYIKCWVKKRGIKCVY